MSPKFLCRTVRNVIFRSRPYFAHLAFTHRCNLRCRFCHIQEEKMEELDAAGMKRIIDRLDHLGIAVLSICGGGEPLLRNDFAELLNYASAKGMYTKITSNGTLSTAKYRELLASGVSEIAISLDGVDGNDLPYSHVGPKILATLRYLNDHLPAGKQLTINLTVSSANREEVPAAVACCTQEFPKARIWLNPVVVGEGKLRVPTQSKVDPDCLRPIQSPTLLTPEFYRRACEEYYRSKVFNWGCRAGELFFDVKPNGDFWICQDHPCQTPLNILEDDFERKYRAADFTNRRNCSGCTYSCYYLTQKSFEPRAWPAMAELWWKARTQPDEPCRRTADRRGWIPALLHYSVSRLRLSLQSAARASLWLIILAVALGGGPASGQTPLAAMDAEEILTRMEEGNAARFQALDSFQGRRRYFAENPRLRQKAFVVVETRYDAGQGKQFRILERGGSRAVERRVFVPMLETETANSKPRAREAVDICRRNYVFSLEGLDAATHAFIFTVKPRTDSRYLFRGRIWVDADDFAIQRIEGEPAQRLSFWLRSNRFVHEYAKFGSFWFPIRNRTEVQLRLFGKSRMGIDYYGYQWQPETTHLSPKFNPPAILATYPMPFPMSIIPADDVNSPNAPILLSFLGWFGGFSGSRQVLGLELVALSHRVSVLERKSPRARLEMRGSCFSSASISRPQSGARRSWSPDSPRAATSASLLVMDVDRSYRAPGDIRVGAILVIA